MNRGKVRLTLEEFEKLLHLPKKHKVVDIWRSTTDRELCTVSIVIEGEGMPIQGEAESLRLVRYETLLSDYF